MKDVLTANKNEKKSNKKSKKSQSSSVSIKDLKKSKSKPTNNSKAKKRKIETTSNCSAALRSEDDSAISKQEMVESMEVSSEEKEKDGKDGKEEKKEKKKYEKRYNDKNVDYNLYNEAPENIVTTKIKLSNTCMIVCKTIEANGDSKGLTYDMAAMVICRKLRTGDMFEFTLPLNLAPNLKTAMELIMAENERFFEKKQISSLTKR